MKLWIELNFPPLENAKRFAGNCRPTYILVEHIGMVRAKIKEVGEEKLT